MTSTHAGSPLARTLCYGDRSMSKRPDDGVETLIETTEAFTTPQLIARYKAEFPALQDVSDLDVLRFGTPEEGEESRRTLKAKYGIRKLEVVMLEMPKEQPITPSPAQP